MPLSVSVDSVRAGPASRKRTHDQITRSLSRSQTPTVPSKRRRISNSENRIPSASPALDLRSSPPVSRPERSQFDFRRPRNQGMAQAVSPNTIDLTLEDNSPPPASPPSYDHDADIDDLFDASDFSIDLSESGPPQINRTQGQDPEQPITISDSDDEDLGSGTNQPPESPEVQWVGQRQITPRPASPHVRNLPPLAEILRRPSSQPDFRRGTPPELRRANAQTFRDTLRNAPGTLFDFGRTILGAAMGPVIPPTGGHHPNLAHFPGNARSWLARNIPVPLDPAIYDDHDDDDYGAIEFDYNGVGFPLDALEIIDPVADEAAAAAAAAAAATAENVYKPPPAAREGFTRDIEEDDGVLVCVSCEDELASGDDDVKQQVWVARSCGHVFCGSCASQRAAYRAGNDRNRMKAKRAKIDRLKTCTVPDCNSKLTGKTAMFQVYL